MRKIPKFDTVLALTVLFLLIFGLIMITSIGVPKSIALSAPGELYPNCSDASVDCYLLFKRHVVRLAIGLIGFMFAFKAPIKWWKRMAPYLFGATIFLLLFVLIFGSSHGTIATSWITVFNTSLQPSELAKLAIILYLARWLASKRDTIESFSDGFVPFLVITGALLGLVVLQNDFGSTMVLGLIGLGMFFSAGAKMRHIALTVFMGLLAGIIVISTASHVRERFQGFMRVDEECIEDYCWQSQQANIAVGSGGFWGKGLTQGVQKSYWLPQASDDFIFAASAEELGFLRIIFIVLAYYIIALRGYRIADRAQNQFEMYVAIGVTTWIVMQAFVNIAVNTALLPVTGITLPFVSYGGSSLLASLIGIGLLLNISQHTTYHANNSNRRWNRGTRHTQRGRYRRA